MKLKFIIITFAMFLTSSLYSQEFLSARDQEVSIVNEIIQNQSSFENVSSQSYNMFIDYTNELKETNLSQRVRDLIFGDSTIALSEEEILRLEKFIFKYPKTRIRPFYIFIWNELVSKPLLKDFYLSRSNNTITNNLKKNIKKNRFNYQSVKISRNILSSIGLTLGLGTLVSLGTESFGMSINGASTVPIFFAGLTATMLSTFALLINSDELPELKKKIEKSPYEEALNAINTKLESMEVVRKWQKVFNEKIVSMSNIIKVAGSRSVQIHTWIRESSGMGIALTPSKEMIFRYQRYLDDRARVLDFINQRYPCSSLYKKRNRPAGKQES